MGGVDQTRAEQGFAEVALAPALRGAQKIFGDAVEPVWMVRALGQRRRAESAALASEVANDRIPLDVDAAALPLDLDLIEALLRGPGEKDSA